MATDLARLLVRLEAQTSQYQQQLEGANRRLDRFAQQQNSSLDVIKKAFKTLGVVVASIKFTSLITNAVDAANHLDDLSVRLGITTEDLSELQYAAELTGVSSGTLEMGLQRMTRRIAEAGKGSGEAVKALNALNLSAKDLAKLNPAEQFMVLADALEGVSNQGDKVALAMKLFDSEGVKLIQTMEGGSDAVRELMDQFAELGGTMSTETAEGATELNAKLIAMKASVSGIANVILERLIPVLNTAADWLAKVHKQIAGFMNVTALEELVLVTEEIALAQSRLDSVFINIPGARLSWQKKLNDALERQAELIAEIQGLPADIKDLPPLPTVGGADPIVKSADAADKAAKAAQKKIDGDIKRAADEQKRAQELAANKFEFVRASLLSEEDALNESYMRRRDIVADALARDIVTQSEHNDTLLKLDKDLADDKTALAKKESDAKRDNLASMFGMLAQITDSENEKLLNIQRGAAILSIGISGQKGIMEAWGQGPIIGPIMATLVGAQMALSIAKVAAPRALGGPVAGGSTYLVGEKGPELFKPSTAGTIVPNNQMGGNNVNVNIIEDAERGGQVQQEGNNVQVFVAAAMSHLNDEFNSGRGLFANMEQKYSLSR